MDRTIVINAEHRETRVAMLENGRLVELHVEQKTAESAVGNVYLGKVINTVPAIQAAFVDLGLERHGFLHLGDLRLPGGEIDRNAKIGQVLNKGQKLLVQVQKDPIATKGFKLSMDISLPGRYSVLMPLTQNTGVSRSISDPEERKRLRSIRKEAGVEDLGVIIRTVAEGKAKSEVARDLRYLMRLWKALQEAAETREEPGIVYREPDLVEKTLRDTYKQGETRIIVDDEPCRKRIIRFLSLYYPRHEFIGEVLLHAEPTPIFKKHDLDRELEKALRRRVELESGGFLLMEESETLTAIDVNSGKLTKTSGPEETAVRTNLEAAEEVGRQLRLRDIGGMIIVDFIQMGTKKQRNRVYTALKKALSHDRSRTKMSYFSDLELVQITRRRVRESLEKQMTEHCPYCKGEGTIFSKETIASQIVRDLREILFTHFPSVVKAWLNPDVYHLLMEDQRFLRDLGHRTGTSIVLIPDPDRHIQDYSLKPEGIPVVLATTSESKRLRQELLARLQEPGASAPKAEEPAAAEEQEAGLLLPIEPEEVPEAVLGFWGDRQLEEERQQAELHEADEIEEDEDDDDDEEEEAAAAAAAAAARPDRSGARRGREGRNGRGRQAERGERRGSPEAGRASRPAAHERKGRGDVPARKEAAAGAAARHTAGSSPSAAAREEARQPSAPERPFVPLSFRAGKGSRLRFSSRDLKLGRDFGRQYELWASPAASKAAPPPAFEDEPAVAELLEEPADTPLAAEPESAGDRQKTRRRKSKRRQKPASTRGGGTPPGESRAAEPPAGP